METKPSLAFPLTIATPDYTKEHVDAEEYLCRVKHEAQQLPIVTYAKPIAATAAATTTTTTTTATTAATIDLSQFIDIEETLSDFKWLRRYLRVVKKRRNGHIRELQGQHRAFKDIDDWKEFCTGTGTNTSKPLVSHVLVWQQRHVQTLLGWHIQLIVDDDCSNGNLECWCFALLSRLDTLLNSDLSADLTRLYRYCHRQLSVHSNPEYAVIMCLIKHFFDIKVK